VCDEHPNIVPIHEIGVDAQKRIFFSMKSRDAAWRKS
jgi:hypothetical protein